MTTDSGGMNDWIRARSGHLPEPEAEPVDDNRVDFDGGARTVPLGPPDMNRALRRAAGFSW